MKYAFIERTPSSNAIGVTGRFRCYARCWKSVQAAFTSGDNGLLRTNRSAAA